MRYPESSMVILAILLLVALTPAPSKAQPSLDAIRFIEEGDRPPVAANAGRGIRLEPGGIEGLGCMLVPRIGPGLICDYGSRMVRTVGRDLARFCDALTERVTDLGEGDLENREDPGIQQCRHVVNRMHEMARRVRSGQLRPEGTFDAATAVHRRISNENRAWMRMRGMARGQCRTEDQKQAFDRNFDALQRCVRDIWPALNEISAAERSRR